MGFKSKEGPPGVSHGVKGSTESTEAVYPMTSNHEAGEDRQFVGGGWGGWNGGEESEGMGMSILIGIERREKE